MLCEAVLSADCVDGLAIRCCICKETLADNALGALTRFDSHDDFQAWCRECFRKMAILANDQMDQLELMYRLFK